MTSNTGNTLLALVVGATLGAVAGILFAPDKGSNTRHKIKEGYDEAKDNFIHKLDDATKGLRKKFSRSSDNLDETYEHLVSNINDKKEDVISFLENKLAELKKQNSELQN
jgi:gas vesicle protein